MGARSSAKFNPTRGVIGTIQNLKFKIQNFQAFFRLSLFFFAFFAVNSYAQDAVVKQKDRDEVFSQWRLAEVFRKGTVEQKRDALFEIRNLKSEIYSRIAVPALRDASEIVRATAAFAVIFLPADEAFAALAPNLQDKSEIVRQETAYALGKIQNPKAIVLLIQTFQNKREKSGAVKTACVVALGEIGDASAVDFLTQILRQSPTDESDFLRRSAARSIGQIAQFIQIGRVYTVTPESFLPEKFKLLTLEKYENLSLKFSSVQNAVPVLMQILRNSKEANDTKREAAFALGAIGDATALPVLQTNLSSKDYYLAEISREAVKKISSADFPS